MTSTMLAVCAWMDLAALHYNFQCALSRGWNLHPPEHAELGHACSIMWLPSAQLCQCEGISDGSTHALPTSHCRCGVSFFLKKVSITG